MPPAMKTREKKSATPLTLVEIIDDVNKTHGPGTMLRGTDLVPPPPRITTGALSYDVSLGGGWARGKFHEVIAEYSQGKTSTILQAIATNQRIDPEFATVWVAAEDFDKEWAIQNGVDLSRVLLLEQNISEVVWKVVLRCMASREIDLIVVDSLSHLSSAEEDDKEIEELTVAANARLNNKFFRKAGSAMRRKLTDEGERWCTCVIVNQFRDKINGASSMPHADNRTTPGGRGKDFAYATRTELRRVDFIEHNKRNVGITIRAKNVKNKTATPRQVAEMDFYNANVVDTETGEMVFRAGQYDTTKDISLTALGLGVVRQGGAYYHFGEHRWYKKETFMQALRDDPALVAAIRAETLRLIDPANYVEPEPEPKPKRKLGIKRGN